jgi:hypothetical protein
VLLEQALPEPTHPPPAEDPVDYERVTEALLAGGGADLDEPSRRALEDLLPYTEVCRVFCESLVESEQGGGA